MKTPSRSFGKQKTAEGLAVKSGTEAVRVARQEIAAVKRFKALMKKNTGKLSFAGHLK
ncbi:MAG TPA: hypothetical protein VN948_17770 [Terriglobales bacterium]|nr:hypothetical protein [Terriglobales bacterium]